MICAHCYFNIPPGAPVCGHCGRDQPPPKPEPYIPGSRERAEEERKRSNAETDRGILFGIIGWIVFFWVVFGLLM